MQKSIRPNTAAAIGSARPPRSVAWTGARQRGVAASSYARRLALSNLVGSGLILSLTGIAALACGQSGTDANQTEEMLGGNTSTAGLGGQAGDPIAPGISGAAGANESGGTGGMGGAGGASAGSSAVGGVGGDDTGVSAGAAGASGGASASAGAGGSLGVMDPGTEGDGNVSIEAPFMRARESDFIDGVPGGTVSEFTMPASASEIYQGDRDVAIYVPNGYVSGTEIPFMVYMDGTLYGHLDRFQPILDNLIDEGRIPAMAGIFVNPVEPGEERSVEYDTVSDAYLRFTEDELLPYVKTEMAARDVDLNLTENPEGRGAYGGSSGGSCAFIMGWFGPDKYRRLLTISGSFRPLQPTADYPNGAAEFQEHLIAEAEAKPLRVFLTAGSDDFPGWKQANDEVAAALAAKGYHYRYVFADGAMHVDNAAMAQYLPEAMEWLWRGYPIQ